jgi:hypothetical protein
MAVRESAAAANSDQGVTLISTWPLGDAPEPACWGIWLSPLGRPGEPPGYLTGSTRWLKSLASSLDTTLQGGAT